MHLSTLNGFFKDKSFKTVYENTSEQIKATFMMQANVTPSIKLPFFEILYKSVFAGNKYFAQLYLVAANNAILPDKARNSEIPIALH